MPPIVVASIISQYMIIVQLFNILYTSEDRLSRKMVLAFIAAVYVFDPNTIEVVFQYEDEIRKLMGSLEREEHIALTV